MANLERIEKICHGKTIRIFSAQQEEDTVSFVETFRNCGRCLRCRESNQKPHGPYWNLNYVDTAGKPKTVYVGRLLPEIARKHSKVLFADVIQFYEDRGRHEEITKKYRDHIAQLKQQIEDLYENQRASKRQVKRGGSSGKLERVFRHLATKYHPDRHSGKRFEAEEIMKDINQLYQLME
ncbi:MAG: hypothetical protein C5B54_07105 [Acidobacteria bacterium]|nr:MAG: hypothetical protein C5B54_07105 [Acidobacteriota bacterium]